MPTQRTIKKTQSQGIPYRTIRGALIRKGINLKRWAEQNNFPLTTVYHAARGDRAGIKATLIRSRLIAYVNAA